ncbi:MAG: hypothetical protein IT372_25730 [Polyangiaceae bacterium]|nr:hypothetical protein [Polyangiaceae bacterium]
MVRNVAAALALVGAGLLGCAETGRIDLYTCKDPCGNGQPGTSCEHPCGDCRGQCVPLPPADFSDPVLLWTGSDVDAPQCPPHAPVPFYEGHAGFDPGNYCPACECSPPACMFPSRMTASDQTCPGGGTQTKFEAPPFWTGACFSPPAVPVDLAASVTAQPVTEHPCQPVGPPVPTSLDRTWSTFARACKGQVYDGRCRDPGMTCEPTAEPPPPGFRHCIMYTRDGDPTCPASYPEELTFYGGLDDTRACAPCECTQTAPSECVATITTYHGAKCAGFIFASFAMDLGSSAACMDNGMSSAGLGSMSAIWLVNEPGECAASGGEASGEATPTDPRTFCCQAAP